MKSGTIAELVSEFADAIGNETLASLAISRVWQRTEYIYPTTYIYYVGRYGSGLQMNSETQPWGDVATEDYVTTWDPTNLQLYWASLPHYNGLLLLLIQHHLSRLGSWSLFML